MNYVVYGAIVVLALVQAHTQNFAAASNVCRLAQMSNRGAAFHVADTESNEPALAELLIGCEVNVGGLRLDPAVQRDERYGKSASSKPAFSTAIKPSQLTPDDVDKTEQVSRERKLERFA